MFSKTRAGLVYFIMQINVSTPCLLSRLVSSCRKTGSRTNLVYMLTHLSPKTCSVLLLSTGRWQSWYEIWKSLFNLNSQTWYPNGQPWFEILLGSKLWGQIQFDSNTRVESYIHDCTLIFVVNFILIGWWHYLISTRQTHASTKVLGV